MSKTRQPPSIITKFARQFGHILADELTAAPQKKSIHSLSERVFIKVLLTLSNSAFYRGELLFQDFASQKENYMTGSGKSQRVYTEAFYYAEELLSRRIMLVSKLGRLPSNLHLLLLLLCRNGADERWKNSLMERYLHVELHIHDAFFKPVADILKKLCNNRKENSAYATNTRKEHGPFYLCTGHNRAEVPDELSFSEVIDVIEAVPTPLNQSFQQSPEYTKLVEHIVLSLNEEYGLLRSYGVPPLEFKGKHSIGELRELKKLKKLADQDYRQGLSANLYDAFANVFKDMQSHSDGKKVGGFASFEAFAASEIGMRKIWPDGGISSLDDENSPYDEPSASEDMAEIDWERFIEENSDKFSPLMAYVFQQVIVLKKPFQGAKGLLQDPRFIELVANDPNYADLTGDTLLDKLIQKLARLIKKHLPPDFDPDSALES